MVTLSSHRQLRLSSSYSLQETSNDVFSGVSGQADGSFRHKPKGQFTSVRETLVGIPTGTNILERRFICDTIISDQKPTIEALNSLAAAFRGTIVHSFGKISLAVDLPDQLPVMVFNETNIKQGTFNLPPTL